MMSHSTVSAAADSTRSPFVSSPPKPPNAVAPPVTQHNYFINVCEMIAREACGTRVYYRLFITRRHHCVRVYVVRLCICVCVCVRKNVQTAVEIRDKKLARSKTPREEFLVRVRIVWRWFVDRDLSFDGRLLYTFYLDFFFTHRSASSCCYFHSFVVVSHYTATWIVRVHAVDVTKKKKIRTCCIKPSTVKCI